MAKSFAIKVYNWECVVKGELYFKFQTSVKLIEIISPTQVK